MFKGLLFILFCIALLIRLCKKNSGTVKKGGRYCHRHAVANSAYRRAHKLKGDAE